VKLAAAIAAVLFAPAVAAAEPIVHTDTHEVRACAPLADGALVGTGGGLVRVDGKGAQRAVWTASDGLPGTRIETIVRDGDGWWIGTDGGGARVRLGGDELTPAIAIDRSVASAAMHDVVRHGGALYAATWNGVVKLGARGKGTPVPWKGAARGPRMHVAALASSGGSLWAGTAAGLFVLRGGRLEAVALEGAHASAGVTSLHADGDGLWIATSDGLFVRDARGVRRIGGSELTHVTTVEGAIVVAGLGTGLEQVDRGRLIAFAGAPHGLALAQTVSEHDGAACAGGLDGLWLRPRASTAWTEAPHQAGLPSNDISALAVDHRRLWVGTFDRGLAVSDNGGGFRTIAHPDLDGRINALLVEPRAGKPSRLWVATAAGLMMLDGPDVKDVARLTRRDGLPGRGVLSLARLRDGRVIAGTSTGAVIVSDGRPMPVGPAGTDIGNVWAVGEDADGMLWLGTTTGVWRGPSTVEGKVDRGAAWKRMSVATGHLDDDWVMAIAPRGRAVWVGGYKGGVVRFDLDDLKGTRLGGGWVNPGGLRWEGETLYASTQEGLRSGDGASATWKTEAGLPGKDVTAMVRIADAYWVATRRGLVYLTR